MSEWTEWKDCRKEEPTLGTYIQVEIGCGLCKKNLHDSRRNIWLS